MRPVPPPAELQPPVEGPAPGAARRFLRDAACSTHNARVLDDAVLLVSELVTNALLHGTPPITVHVECDGGRELLVSVTDENPRSPVLRDGGPEDESGRGIRLADVVSDRWGVSKHPDDGKKVWFRLQS